MGRPRKIKEEIKKLSRPIQHVPGMHDVLPQDWKLWDFCLEKFIRLAKAHGFQRIQTPILEKTDLFVRSMGEATDVVEKEMFTFQDKEETKNITTGCGCINSFGSGIERQICNDTFRL